MPRSGGVVEPARGGEAGLEAALECPLHVSVMVPRAEGGAGAPTAARTEAARVRARLFAIVVRSTSVLGATAEVATVAPVLGSAVTASVVVREVRPLVPGPALRVVLGEPSVCRVVVHESPFDALDACHRACICRVT